MSKPLPTAPRRADLLVAGTAVFGAADYESQLALLNKLAKQGVDRRDHQRGGGG